MGVLSLCNVCDVLTDRRGELVERCVPRTPVSEHRLLGLRAGGQWSRGQQNWRGHGASSSRNNGGAQDALVCSIRHGLRDLIQAVAPVHQLGKRKS